MQLKLIITFPRWVIGWSIVSLHLSLSISLSVLLCCCVALHCNASVPARRRSRTRHSRHKFRADNRSVSWSSTLRFVLSKRKTIDHDRRVDSVEIHTHTHTGERLLSNWKSRMKLRKTNSYSNEQRHILITSDVNGVRTNELKPNAIWITTKINTYSRIYLSNRGFNSVLAACECDGSHTHIYIYGPCQCVIK